MGSLDMKLLYISRKGAWILLITVQMTPQFGQQSSDCDQQLLLVPIVMLDT